MSIYKINHTKTIMKTKTRSQLLTAIIMLLFPVRALSQVSLPFVLGKEYFRSEITAVIGTPERFGYDLFAGEDDLDILMYGKGIIINQLYTNLNLRWVSDKNGIYPIVNFQSGKFTKRRAPLNGIALTDPTYRILEDKIPGGLYVGMPRTALKAIEGEHTDGRPGIHENNYRIVFDDDTMVLMYYNAWDRVTFIEYIINHTCGIFSWPKEDPYTPVDEKDTLVTTFRFTDGNCDLSIQTQNRNIDLSQRLHFTYWDIRRIQQRISDTIVTFQVSLTKHEVQQ